MMILLRLHLLPCWRRPIIVMLCAPSTFGGTALQGFLIADQGLWFVVCGSGSSDDLMRSNLIPRRLLISLVNLSSSASPEAGLYPTVV
jgi:hypothetical protein